MDGYLLDLKNHSTDAQEIDLFNSSDQDGRSTGVTWIFQCDNMFSYGVNPVYNTASSLWFDQAISANPGTITVSYEVPGGGSASKQITGLTDIDFTHIAEKLNEPAIGDLHEIGVWRVVKGATTQSFQFICNVKESFEGNIDLTTKTLGAEAMSFTGTGFTTYTADANDNPNDFYRSMASNKNIEISTFNDFNYTQFLYSVTQRNYDVKQFEIFSTNKNQLLEPFLFDRKLATGKVYQKVLTPTIDPYQSNNYLRTDDRKGYVIDGFTKLKYKVLPSSSARLVMRYNYIDLATPLMVTKIKKTERFYNQAGQYNPAVLTPLNSTFTSNIDTGYDTFGCKFLNSRLAIQEGKLNDLETAGTNPRWQAFLRERIQYIKDKLQSENCEVKQEIPQFSTIGDEYKPRDLFIPTNDFIQHQIDTEQGAQKLLEDTDFPIDQSEVA
tara:strand:+ start:128 stop:1447 length:1320 start_codon:yes stop_codon:yes gene_type:complete